MSLDIFIGGIGSGKTTHAARSAYRAVKHGRTVYTNIPDMDIDGVTYIPTEYIGKYQIENCLLIVDEAGIDYNNRLATKKGGSPSMNQDAIRWWKLIRHYGVDAIVYSQAQDFDVTLRRLATRLYIIRKSLLPWWSSYRQLVGKWVTDTLDGNPEYHWDFKPFSTRFIFRPRWYRYFNSWVAPVLPPLPTADRGSQDSRSLHG